MIKKFDAEFFVLRRIMQSVKGRSGMILVYQIGTQQFQTAVCLRVIMNIQTQRLTQIEAENPHDGFGIYHITAYHQIQISFNMCCGTDKVLDFIDGIQYKRISCKVLLMDSHAHFTTGLH